MDYDSHTFEAYFMAFNGRGADYVKILYLQ